MRRKLEADPGRVVRVVGLEEGIVRVRRGHEVVGPVRRAGQIELLSAGRLVVLVDPACPHALEVSETVPERSLARAGVAVERIDLDEAEADLERAVADDRACQAALTNLEPCHVRRVPVMVARVVLEDRCRLFVEQLVAGGHLLRLGAALVFRVVRADLLKRRRRRVAAHSCSGRSAHGAGPEFAIPFEKRSRSRLCSLTRFRCVGTTVRRSG